MGQQKQRNRRWVLASRPHGAPVPENFRLEEDDVATPGEGQVLLRTVYLSLDPYMRGRMSDEPSYSPPVDIGGVMVGGTVSRVVKSNHPDYQPGDWVLGYSGWQDYDISSGDDLVKLGDHPQNPSWSLGVLGMPGFTAYMGLLDIGQPKQGETLVVAAATGPVGATVGQIGKLKGCRVVGVAGGAEKCRHATEVLGFDVCLDHHADDFAEQLAKACPKGIDIYYENVGGKVFDAVLPLLNTSARIPVCGLVSSYNATELPPGPDRLPLLMATVLKKRIRLQGFIIAQDYGHRIHEFQKEMGQWVKEDKIHYREEITDGLENAPQTFIGLLKGKNFGKVVIRVAGDD
ncbi:NADPH-dependent curcumin/dihydrocurcumin reductase [Escherichia coli]|uniref:NADPH-dependent curcumin/dihydrocurcumin reductase n=1 Tax=Escherichia coli TaxID=562 RepID=UPI00092AC774|nr:NADPH-dependent curcumin/dihydrocurcumin reductase [Escherichia coli]AUX63894.1 NADP-dependent oxidoreductase [Escherichia coli]EFO5533112.1 NADPH-dependent curcumin/dihydrocurcumin reductase [Escherichia coli]EHP1139033.1 NADPH-dependent curcumin/dihydrocurcumin reductase [Escherichia coli]EIT3803537.1 NADPH-dependent curcumin/dihydrocurcumin reductase [Escherichia coli]EJB9883899.1 NADPH-dependent curcumin/dihydrocurcumin reductase [Escherichia coli]